MASSIRPATCTFSSPNTSIASSARSVTDIDRGDELRVTTTSSNESASASRMPRASLSAITASTPTNRENENSAASASARAVAPCGLCAASTMIVGEVRTRSSRPGEATAANPSCTEAMSSWRLAPAPRNASTAASATAAFVAWCSPASGRKMSS